MIKSISFIVLTQFFHFSELKIKATRLLNFFKLNQQYFFYSEISVCQIEFNVLYFFSTIY